jgi:hypothetical protein
MQASRESRAGIILLRAGVSSLRMGHRVVGGTACGIARAQPRQRHDQHSWYTHVVEGGWSLYAPSRLRTAGTAAASGQVEPAGVRPPELAGVHARGGGAGSYYAYAILCTYTIIS